MGDHPISTQQEGYLFPKFMVGVACGPSVRAHHHDDLDTERYQKDNVTSTSLQERRKNVSTSSSIDTPQKVPMGSSSHADSEVSEVSQEDALELKTPPMLMRLLCSFNKDLDCETRHEVEKRTK